MKEYDLSHVRYVMVGAAPLSAELHNQVIAMFPQAHLGQAYGSYFAHSFQIRGLIIICTGMTETCTVVSLWPIDKKRGLIGSAGQLVSGVTVRVIKKDGTLCKYGETGELIVKSPSNAIGYYDNAEA